MQAKKWVSMMLLGSMLSSTVLAAQPYPESDRDQGHSQQRQSSAQESRQVQEAQAGRGQYEARSSTQVRHEDKRLPSSPSGVTRSYDNHSRAPVYEAPRPVAGYQVTPRRDHSQPRYHLGDDAVKVLLGGLTLWTVGNLFYQWQPENRYYAPVDVNIGVGVSDGPYYERLPRGSNAILVQGHQYFVHDGIYFRPVQRNGVTLYLQVNL